MECPSGLRQFTRPQGMMSLTDFKHIIDQASPDLMYLMLYFQGEPLMNPAFFDMVSYAKEKRVYTATSSNGHFLDDENARMLVESGLDRLIISLDGADQEAYEKYRRHGDFRTVREAIENVMTWRKKLRSSKPYTIIQFLVFRHNEHQLPGMRKLAKELGVDRLEFKSAQVYDLEKDQGLIPENSKYSRYVKGPDGIWKLKKPVRNRCWRMWSGAVITWDGGMVPCCFDKDAAHQFGRLGEKPFRAIWKSEAYNRFRNQILKDRGNIEICNNCTE
jgi:radical SAM protein with 4Fe4S-binding SPASM domain